MRTLRVVIADDHPLYRAGLRVLIAGQPDLLLIGEAATTSEVMGLVEAETPDVVLMDIAMPGAGGIDATRRITSLHPQIAVVMLTMAEDPASVLAAMRAGARGYLVKGAGGDEALRAIRAAANGELIIGAEVSAGVMSQLSFQAGRAPASPFPDLTQRELEILQLMAQGYTNSAIATRLFLGPKTVRNYVSNVFRKLEVTSRVDAVLRAKQSGMG